MASDQDAELQWPNLYAVAAVELCLAVKAPLIYGSPVRAIEILHECMFPTNRQSAVPVADQTAYWPKLTMKISADLKRIDRNRDFSAVIFPPSQDYQRDFYVGIVVMDARSLSGRWDECRHASQTESQTRHVHKTLLPTGELKPIRTRSE
jgi:hypothetical protein